MSSTEQAGGGEPRFYSQVAADAMRREIERLTTANAKLEAEVAFWRQQTNHWYMRANYTPAEIAEFDRRRALTIDPETGERLPTPTRQEQTD